MTLDALDYFVIVNGPIVETTKHGFIGEPSITESEDTTYNGCMFRALEVHGNLIAAELVHGASRKRLILNSDEWRIEVVPLDFAIEMIPPLTTKTHSANIEALPLILFEFDKYNWGEWKGDKQ